MSNNNNNQSGNNAPRENPARDVNAPALPVQNQRSRDGENVGRKYFISKRFICG